MDNPRWLRLIVVGLILAALVVGYSLLTGGFVKSKPATKAKTPISSPATSASPSVLPAVSPPSSANNRITDKSQRGVQTLPRTGFPLGLTVTFAISTMIAGWSMRRFPH